MCTMDESKALAAISCGHNMLITGQAGTGKTTFVKKVAKALISAGKRVAVACTTGIAATHYLDVGGTTIHRWAGLLDGRYGNTEFAQLFPKDDTFVAARANVSGTDVLILDEISMLSLKDFEQLEIACRLGGPKADMLFGGIQIVTCGDVFQLRPVWKNVSRQYCFEAEWWKRLLPHHLHLNQVHRTSDEQLIRAVHETAIGRVSTETDVYLSSLGRPTTDTTDTIALFSNNFELDVYNAECIHKMAGDSTMYRSTDTGARKILKSITAPQLLLLKVGAPVLLLRNLSNRLVNGLRGHVVALRKTEADVQFLNLIGTHTITQFNFIVHDALARTTLATRSQLPLKLAFGVTIHKSQGMTLPSVRVHCSGIKEPGQLSVAIGRVTSAENLQVIGYSREVVFEHPPQVYECNSQPHIPVRLDTNCCRQYYVPNFEMDSSFDDSDDQGATEPSSTEVMTDMSDDIDVDLSFAVSDDAHILDGASSEINRNEELVSRCNQLMTPPENIVSEQQEDSNQVLAGLAASEYASIWYANQKTKVMSIIKEDHPDFPECSPKPWSTFCGAIFRWLNSPDFLKSLDKLYQLENQSLLTLSQRHVAVDVVMGCRDTILSEAVNSRSQTEQLTDSPIIRDVGRAKVRDLAGMCVTRARSKYMALVSRNLYREESHQRSKVEHGSRMVRETRRLETPGPTNPEDTSHDLVVSKKRKGDMVTFVTDDCFEYFLDLTNMLTKHLTVGNLKVRGGSILNHIAEISLADPHLDLLWQKTQVSRELQRAVTFTFIKVFGKQFRKDTKDKLKVKPKKALRKQLNQVSVSSANTSVPGKLNTLIKEKVSTDKGLLAGRQMTKSEILSACKAYGLPAKPSSTKANLCDTLVDAILNGKTITCEECLPAKLLHLVGETPAEVVQGGKGKRKGKGKGKGKGKRVKYSCVICGKEFIEEDCDWVQCDVCEGWVDRSCAGLEEEEDWEEACVEGTQFICQKCKGG